MNLECTDLEMVDEQYERQYNDLDVEVDDNQKVDIDSNYILE